MVLDEANYYIADDAGNQLQIYDTFKNGLLEKLNDGDKIVLKGIYYVYKNKYQVAPVSIDVVEGTESVTITESLFATYFSDKALSIVNTGLKAYTAYIENGYVILNAVDNVPSYTPVILEASMAGEYELIVTEDFEPTEELRNDLLISTGDEDTPDAFVLADKEKYGVGFYKWAGSMVPENRVYLSVSDPTVATREFIGFGSATGIAEIGGVRNAENEVFNLAGQRVVVAQKGLYIVNGKKVVKK